MYPYLIELILMWPLCLQNDIKITRSRQDEIPTEEFQQEQFHLPELIGKECVLYKVVESLYSRNLYVAFFKLSCRKGAVVLK